MSDTATTQPGPSARLRNVPRPVPVDRGHRRPARPRVAVVERHALVAEAIGAALPSSFEIIPISLAPCTRADAAREAILRSRPDLVVLILTPDAVDTLTLVEQLSDHDVSVLVTGDNLDPARAYGYLCAGAAAFWCRGGVDAVVRAVTREARLRAAREPASRPRRMQLPRPHAAGLYDYDEDARARRGLASLTAAEARILGAMMQGRCAAEIARDHVVSVRTVRTQIKRILGKLGVTAQLSAVALAWRVGWTPAGDLRAS